MRALLLAAAFGLCASGCGGAMAPSSARRGGEPSCGAPRPLEEVRPIALRWRADPWASELWIVDHLSRWSAHHTLAEYEEALAGPLALDDGDREALALYAAVRRALSHDAAEEEEIHLLSPRSLAFERFASTAMSATDAADAAVKLGLEGEAREGFLAPFSRLHARIAQMLASATYLARLEARLAGIADAAELPIELGRAARFFGVRDQVTEPVTIELLWAPPRLGSATQYGPRMIVPVPEADADDDVAMRSSLGVIVHELGHYFVGLLPLATERALSDRLLASVGLPNVHHPNLFDEATHTALGNISFIRRRAPEADIDPTYYAFEPENTYPHAIDSLARALVAPLEACIDVPGAYGGPFFARALVAHRRVFPARPLHFSRAVVGYAESRSLSNLFKRTFAAVSRSIHAGEDAEEAFREEAALSPASARWILVSAGAARDGRVDGELLGVPELAALGARVDSGPHAGCAWMVRTTEEGAPTFVLIAKDARAMRAVIVAVHGMSSLPGEDGACVDAAP